MLYSIKQLWTRCGFSENIGLAYVSKDAFTDKLAVASTHKSAKTHAR